LLRKHALMQNARNKNPIALPAEKNDVPGVFETP
jgi:hypothetical protein